jgi:hypothetical protein
MNEETSRPSPDDVRTEYTALVEFHNSVVAHRFTLVGFYLASIGLIAGQNIGFSEACLIFGLTAAMYIMELRNRTLYTQMGQRALHIEQHYWGLNRKPNMDTGLPLFSMIRQNDLPDKIKQTLTEQQKKQHAEKPKFWGHWKIPGLPANHSRGLDLLYLTVALYAVSKMLFA